MVRMVRGEVPWVQLATRIPKSLHRELKLFCVMRDTSVMDLVVAALDEKLARGRQSRRGKRQQG